MAIFTGMRWDRRTFAFLCTAPAILGLGLLGVYAVLHMIAEPDCPARVSGNPNDCYVCSQLASLALEETPALELPIQVDVRIANPILLEERISSPDLLDLSARSPPASL